MIFSLHFPFIYFNRIAVICALSVSRQLFVALWTLDRSKCVAQPPTLNTKSWFSQTRSTRIQMLTAWPQLDKNSLEVIEIVCMEVPVCIFEKAPRSYHISIINDFSTSSHFPQSQWNRIVEGNTKEKCWWL